MLAFLRRRADIVAAAGLLLLALFAFAVRAWHGVWFSNFGDETGHFVGARVIAAGGTLYRDFVDDHGPLIYAIPQLYAALFGWADPIRTRIVPIAALLLTAAALASSPGLRGVWDRLTATALFIGLTASAWIAQALFMVNYQPLAGMLMVIGLAQFTVPAWYGAPIGAGSLFIASLCLALTPFAAFSYGPAAVVFMASGLWAWRRGGAAADRRAGWQYLLAGIAAAVTTMSVWLLIFADLRGYIAYHFVAALQFYGPYLGFGGQPMFHVLMPRSRPWDLVQAVGVFAGIAAVGLLMAAEIRRAEGRPRQALPVLLGVFGVILTNPRGSPLFQNGAFIMTSCGLLALTFSMCPGGTRPTGRHRSRLVCTMVALLGIVSAEAVTRRAVTSPHMYTRAALPTATDGGLARSDDAWAQRVRQATNPDERVLALPFFPDFYPLAGRLPMKGYYIYLPWDADYARHPVLGMTHDLCSDLARDPPPVIRYDGWIVWGKYDPRQYMPCVIKILADRYVLMPGESILYVRRDRAGRVTK